MAVSFEQVQTAQEFHLNGCKRRIGPKGGKTEYKQIWRRNGKTQTWKTRPGEFKIPVKHGLKNCGYITHINAGLFHIAEECDMQDITVSLG